MSTEEGTTVPPALHAHVVNLSHWDSASDYVAVKRTGIVGVIFKATQGVSYHDIAYNSQRKAAKAAGLLWGAYHFADASDAIRQADNFLGFAQVEPGDLFCLDWEDNRGDMMLATQARDWIASVEKRLGRSGSCVLYSGNTAKEKLGQDKDAFFGARRLWLAQYGAPPRVQVSWDRPWLWQFTDGRVGLPPFSVPGIGRCDVSHYDGSPDDLRAEWADGKVAPAPQAA